MAIWHPIGKGRLSLPQALACALMCIAVVEFFGKVCYAQGERGRRLPEVQLAGIRLGSLAIERDEDGHLSPSCLLRVWGVPDYVIAQLPPMFAPTAAPAAPIPGAEGVAPGAMPGAMPGMPYAPGAPGMMGGAPAGPIQPFGGGTTIIQAPGVLAQTMPPLMTSVTAPGAAGVFGGPPEGAAMPGVMPGMPGAPGVPGAPAPGVPAAPAIAPELSWALPLIVPLRGNQCLWLYRRNGAGLGFIVDGDGAVVGIIVAGEKFDAARTALGNPFKTIMLGDTLQRVLTRYGWPDEIRSASGNMLSRDVELRYHRSSNIVFTLHNYRVTRIFIFIPERAGPD